MNKIIFCQFSSELLNPVSNSLSDNYYNQVWFTKAKDGYWKSKDFWDLPLWIAEICGSLKNSQIEKELYIIKDIEKAIERFNISDNFCYILFSALDINKTLIKEIITKYQGYNGHKFIIGGYIDFSYFDNLNHDGIEEVKILNSIKSFIEYLGIDYHYNLDYSLFAGSQTIPRLTLSVGCKNHCKFCTIPKEVIEKSQEDIFKQVNAFKDLKFKLIYLNDKTFGQASNYKILPDLYNLIKSYNPNFHGFIIQTTCLQILNKDFQYFLMKYNSIFHVIELGIETFNNSLLKGLNKPQTENIIKQAMNFLISLRINVIPNIIIGIIGENKATYDNTLRFLNLYKPYLYLLNIYNLAIYNDTPLSKEVNSKENDTNENIIAKSFYTEKQGNDNEYFYNEIFNFSINLLK